MKRVLVTGSSGFIGSHVQRVLGTSHLTHLADRKMNIDLTHDGAVDWLVDKEPDVIVHLAGSASTPGSMARPLETFSDNVITAVTALEAARLRQIPIIITSSVKARDGKTPYGAAKRMVELWAQEYGDAYKIPVIINRPGTVYGPGQEGSTESGWIAWFVKAAIEGLTVTINGGGQQIRDLLHVTDYAELIRQQVDDPASFDKRIWDVGGGEENMVSVMEVAAFLGLTCRFGPERYGDARVYVGVNDIEGWAPKVLWRDGLAGLVASGAVV